MNGDVFFDKITCVIHVHLNLKEVMLMNHTKVAVIGSLNMDIVVETRVTRGWEKRCLATGSGLFPEEKEPIRRLRRHASGRKPR